MQYTVKTTDTDLTLPADKVIHQFSWFQLQTDTSIYKLALHHGFEVDQLVQFRENPEKSG